MNKYFKEKAGARPASRNHNAIGREAQEGMALIDWFVGMIVSGLYADPEMDSIDPKAVYQDAKGLMKERARLMEVDDNDLD